MADQVQLLGPDGAPAAGRSFAAADGVRLRVTVPPGRRLAEARLSLASADDREQTVLYPALQTDAGAADGQAEAPWRWAAIDWGAERAVTGLVVEARDTSTPPRKSAARIKLFSLGHWLPLTPLDALPTGTVQRFPPLAAARLMAEMLVEGDAGGARSGVPIPGALTGKRMGVILTGQACHVRLAVDDLPPFFAPDGPLPARPQAVDGLTRSLNRYLSDHPGATDIPLTLRAAGTEAVRVGPFTADLEPTRSATDAAPPPPDPHQPRPGERPWFPPGTQPSAVARLIDPRHLAGQTFAALPPGQSLSSVGLRLRPFRGPVEGTVSLQVLRADQPVEPAVAEWPLSFDADRPEPAEAAWVRFRLPEPLTLAGPWRLSCRATSGALCWYVDDSPRPAALQAGLGQTTPGPWLPLDGPGDAPWLQVDAGLLEIAP